VGESTQKPLEYYENNLVSMFNLLFAMKKHGVSKIGVSPASLRTHVSRLRQLGQLKAQRPEAAKLRPMPTL
jgi:UDP-glucose 4-epimerase